jgi:uncharacterized membrane protein YuzA (DUF378 family)
MNPRLSLTTAITLAVVDGVETYIGVIRMGKVEVAILTRLLTTNYGVIGLITVDLLTVLIATTLYMLARLGGLTGLFGLFTLNIINGLRLAVVLSNLTVLLANYNTPIPVIMISGLLIGFVFNVPVLRSITPNP